MKIVLSALVSTLFSFSAYAGQSTFLSVFTGGGMPDPSSRAYEITIDLDGSVLANTYKNYSDVLISSKKILTLSPEVVQGLKITADKIKSEKLTDKNPGSLECYDAPTKTYRIHRGEEDVKIGQIISCKPYEHSQYEANQLSEVLLSFEFLANFSFLKE